MMCCHCILNSLPIWYTVPTPTVVIEAVGEPYNGSIYILTCVVRVDDSVNTNIAISSQWLNDTGPVVTENTISSNSEKTGLEQRHNLTFSPLRSGDDGIYKCTATISPDDGMFVTGSSHNFTTDVTVKGTIFPFKMMLYPFLQSCQFQMLLSASTPPLDQKMTVV